MTLMESSNKVWSKDECRRVLTKHRIEGEQTADEFWAKIFGWYHKQYELAGQPPILKWADNCLEIMDEVQKEMGLKELLTLHKAKATFKSLRVIESKVSLFAKIKEQYHEKEANRGVFGSAKRTSVD